MPSQTGGPDSYDRLADVRFTASGQREQAKVLIDADCNGACLPVYQPGDTVRIAYDARHPATARITGQRGHHRAPGIHLTWDIYSLALLTCSPSGSRCCSSSSAASLHPARGARVPPHNRRASWLRWAQAATSPHPRGRRIAKARRLDAKVLRKFGSELAGCMVTISHCDPPRLRLVPALRDASLREHAAVRSAGVVRSRWPPSLLLQPCGPA
ncbi:MAG TPA: hypothetical protein VGI21_17820 [Streptosporangiaceae bacterium]